MAKLITPTILNSLGWLENCWANTKAKAEEDFFNSLSRNYGPWEDAPEAIRKGVDFENEVYKWADKDREGRGSKKFNEVCDMVKGGNYQKKSKKFLTIDGVEYCIYSKLDVKLPKKIIDLKTTMNYRGPKKYLDTMQHKFYCYTEDCDDFEYVVVTWDVGYTIDQIFVVPFHVEDMLLVEADIVEAVRHFVAFLKTKPRLEEAYEEKFCLYK